MPKVVAVIGASNNRRKFGNRAVRAFRQQGYTVVPINPHEDRGRGAEGLRVGARRAGHDRHGVVLRAAGDRRAGRSDEVARKGIAEVWLNPGAESDALIARARALRIQPIVACSIVAIGENPYDL